MSERYQNKYRIPSARAQWWDYGNDAAYFVTICTRNREHFFGSIIAAAETRLIGVETRLIASPLGEIARNCWLEIPKHFPFVRLDAFVVMPNHVHGIVVIDKTAAAVETRLIASLPPTAIASPTTSSPPPVASPQPAGGFAGNENPMLNDHLPRVIRWYKGRTSFEARKLRADFAWQPRYHDHIIRSAAAYANISNYILDNPARWQEDKFHSA